MGLPASVRINAAFPFPTLVTASGPVTISKVNGIWTVGLSFNGLGTLPVGSDPTTKQVLVYDQVTKAYFVSTIAAILASYTTRTVIAAGNIAVLANDRMILVNQAAPQAVNVILPTAASRGGVPVTVKDFAGVCRNFPLTVTPNGAEKIDNQNAFVINDNFEAVTFNPIATGGWWVG